MNNHLHKSKKGAAAFYVVIFTTLLLSVITMSFIRIMISEATKSTNDDLSKSAYDSALAGVEDAKIALVKYHQCLDQGYTANQTTKCGRIITYMNEHNCDVAAKILGRNNGEGGEVAVKEGSISSSNPESEQMEQAYTCVKIDEELSNYKSTVRSTNRVRLVPIRAKDFNKITGIKFQWFSNRHTNDSINTTKNDFSPLSAHTTSIPPIAVDLYQTDQNFTLGELSVNNGNTGTDRVSLLLNPQYSTSEDTLRLSDTTVLNYSDKADNSPVPANCGYDNGGEEFRCQTIIQFPRPFNGGTPNETTMLLRVELPYGDVESDFAVTLCTGSSLSTLCDTTTEFLGVQAQIDSTGRANDLFRRVEARVELIDTNFPYPEFAAQLSGDDGDNISKDFWVTRNCWQSDESDEEEDPAQECSNSGQASVPGL